MLLPVVQVEEAEEEELGAMFPQRSKLPLMNPLKQVRYYTDTNTRLFNSLHFQQPLKEVSHGEEVLEEDDDDEIEALDNEGVGDEIEDDDEVRILQFLLMSCCVLIQNKQMSR